MENNPSEFVTMMVVLPVMFLSFAWVARGLGRYLLIRRSMIIQSELQNKLLDKYGSAPEVITFLESDAGRSSLELPVRADRSPYSRILAAAQTGIILACLGTAFIALRGQVGEAVEGFAIVGALSLALGLGFLISGVVAYVLSKSWGLIGAGQRTSDESE